MSRKKLVLATIFVFLFTSVVAAQTYELDWEKLQVTNREAAAYTLDWSDSETSISLNIQTKTEEKSDDDENFPTTPEVPEPARERPAPASLQAPQAHLNLLANQWYDYHENIYRVVDRVEVTLYPKEGGIRYQTFQNIGALRGYDVYLKNLTPGDRYEAFIVWDDGSNRTIGDTIRTSGWSSVFVDQPNPLCYKVWPSVW